MTNITQLINAIGSFIPFKSESSAQAFLAQYSLDDQAALISAAYIGRDHIHNNSFRSDYVPQGMTLNRYFVTGDGSPRWFIQPNEFKTILYEKNTALTNYYNAFLRCANGASFNLSTF